MKDIAKRFISNPILSPSDLKPSLDGLEVTCLLNPGVFEFDGKTWILVRVAERPLQKEGVISFPILTSTGEIKIIEITENDPELDLKDPRVVNYQGLDYLTTLSHLRLLCSEDGIKFQEVKDYPPLTGEGALQTFGIEDCRVTYLEGIYYLTFTAVSDSGVCVALRSTTDWKNFTHHGIILPPHNKDCAIFSEKINGKYFALHRPSSVDLGGNYIWITESLDAIHWGNHQCLIKVRKGSWDSARVGAGAAPIKTAKGWLEIYHGANEQHQYCLGAVLLDLTNPAKVLARSILPIMQPTTEYELSGFFGHVVFTNGHILSPDGDTLTIYYGAADEFVCGATLSIVEILESLCYE